MPTFSSYTVRPAVETDFPAIRRLVQTSGINPLGLKWPRFLVAASAGGEIIGCVQAKPHFDGSLELASLAVRPDWQGRGLARALIERLLNTHPGTLYLMCQSSLVPLYARFGFFEIAQEDMPPYFHRISRLASLAKPLLKKGRYLAVMKRAVPASGEGE